MKNQKALHRLEIVATYAKVHKIHFDIALEILGKALRKYERHKYV